MFPVISIFCLLLIGVILLLLEIIVIPGLPIVGFISILFLSGSIWACYHYYGEFPAKLFAGFTIFFCLLLMFFAFKSNIWNKFALNKSLTVNQEKQISTKVEVGDFGVSVSTLRPSGKANFNGNFLEVNSINGLIAAHTKVSVVSIDKGKIFVKTII